MYRLRKRFKYQPHHLLQLSHHPLLVQVSAVHPGKIVNSFPTASASNSNPPDQQSVKQTSPVGAIIGGVAGGCAVLGIGLALCIVSRRRRLRRTQEKFAPSAYLVPSRSHNLGGAPYVQTTTTPPIVGSRKNRGEALTGGSGSSSEPASESVLQPSMREVVDRLRRLEGRASIYGEDPPPNYNGNIV